MPGEQSRGNNQSGLKCPILVRFHLESYVFQRFSLRNRLKTLLIAVSQKTKRFGIVANAGSSNHAAKSHQAAPANTGQADAQGRHKEEGTGKRAIHFDHQRIVERDIWKSRLQK